MYKLCLSVFVFRILIGYVSALSINQSKPCTPVIRTIFYRNNIDSSVVNVDSLTVNRTNLVIPYQFILLNCTAPYPIKWITDIPLPQHYYFSYILDDEVRKLNPSEEIFGIRLHIGNETIALENFKNITVTCIATESIECNTASSITITKPATNSSVLEIQLDTFAINSHELLSLKNEDCQLKQNITPPPLPKNVTNQFNLFECDAPKRTSHKNDSDKNEIHDCNLNGMECWNYQPERQSLKCRTSEKKEYSLSFNESELSSPTGVLTCKSLKNKDEVEKVPFFFSLPNLCTKDVASLPNLYIRTENTVVPEIEFISLCVRNSMHEPTTVVYIGENVTATCITSLFYFASGMRIQEIMQSNQTTESEYLDVDKHPEEKSFGYLGYRNTTVSFAVQSSYVKGIECIAPVRKSRRWVTTEIRLEIKTPTKITFAGDTSTVTIIADDGSTPYLNCNASGDPLPFLTWSRINQEALPPYQNTSMLLSNISDSNSQSWISTKLFFPRGNHNVEYYGRYICTAKNKFESIEKIFILEHPAKMSIFSGIVNALWFWVVVVCILCLVVCLVAILTHKIREQSKRLLLFSKTEIDEFIFGKPELLLGGEEYEDINSYASYLPYNRNQYEIRKDQLNYELFDSLGKGAYGIVYRGYYNHKDEEWREVAIKTVHESSEKMYFAALMSEIKIMAYLGKHENIVEFIGACTKYVGQRKLYVATEFCQNGDMLSYIRQNKDSLDEYCKLNMEANNLPVGYQQVFPLQCNEQLTLEKLVVWTRCIVNGMVYLSSKKLIHGDMAARNILLTADLIPKIADFGLSKQLNKYANYVRKGDELVPFRWLAIESLQYMKFSIKSDVWAFGVVLFEMFSLGQVPYSSCSYTAEFVQELCQGKRLEKPRYAPEKLYRLMLECWNESPDERPTFAHLQTILQDMDLEIDKPVSYVPAANNGYVGHGLYVPAPSPSILRPSRSESEYMHLYDDSCKVDTGDDQQAIKPFGDIPPEQE